MIIFIAGRSGNHFQHELRCFCRHRIGVCNLHCSQLRWARQLSILSQQALFEIEFQRIYARRTTKLGLTGSRKSALMGDMLSLCDNTWVLQYMVFYWFKGQHLHSSPSNLKVHDEAVKWSCLHLQAILIRCLAITTWLTPRRYVTSVIMTDILAWRRSKIKQCEGTIIERQPARSRESLGEQWSDLFSAVIISRSCAR